MSEYEPRNITYRCDGEYEEVLLDGARLSKSDCTDVGALLKLLCEHLGIVFESDTDYAFEDEE